MSEKGKILYSSDGSGKNLVDNKKKNKNYTPVIPKEVTLKLRLEKSGRGGKTVTVVYEIGDNLPHYKKLAKELKAFCGTGGALKEDQIEIQGDQREKVRTFLEKKGYQVKGS